MAHEARRSSIMCTTTPRGGTAGLTLSWNGKNGKARSRTRACTPGITCLRPGSSLRAEGVGLEPTSPCGQRFSSPRINFSTRPCM